MTGDGCVWDTPELWIQSEVARSIREKYQTLVWLEPGMIKFTNGSMFNLKPWLAPKFTEQQDL